MLLQLVGQVKDLVMNNISKILIVIAVIGVVMVVKNMLMGDDEGFESAAVAEIIEDKLMYKHTLEEEPEMEQEMEREEAEEVMEM